MSIGVRRLLAPGVAVAVAVGPAVAAPVARGPLSSAVLPPVHVENIRLAGIGQDIYYAVTPYVQYAVGGVSYLINLRNAMRVMVSADPRYGPTFNLVNDQCDFQYLGEFDIKGKTKPVDVYRLIASR